MTLEQYLENRIKMMEDAEGLIAEGKLEESKAKMKEIEKLDNDWEDVKVANANLNALKDNQAVAELETKNEIIDGVVVGQVELPKNEDEIYVDAWAKHLMNQSMTEDEKNVF